MSAKPTQANVSRRYRAYPSEEQEAALTRWAHGCRTLWNIALQQREWLFTQRRVVYTSFDQGAELTKFRKECDWANDLPASCGHQVLRNLDTAYRYWLSRTHPNGRPQFKKKTSRLSLNFPGQALVVRRLSRRWGAVRVPKLGELKFRWTRGLGGQLRNATISLDSLGWHVSFGVADPGYTITPIHLNRGSEVGLDRGIVVAVADSEGNLHNKIFSTSKERKQELALERRRSRQERNRRKSASTRSRRAQVVHLRIRRSQGRSARRRKDFSMRLAHDLAAQFETIALERLDVSRLTASAKGTVDAPGVNVGQKRGLNRAILDKGWYGFEQALRHQARRTGSVIVTVPAAYTSQTCSSCGHVASESRENQAKFRCVACGFEAHADVNAAINIRERARQSTAGQAGIGLRKSTEVAASTSDRESNRNLSQDESGCQGFNGIFTAAVVDREKPCR